MHSFGLACWDNKAIFIKDYKIPCDLLRAKTFKQKYILIYGRRSDPTLTEGFSEKRAYLQGPDEEFMTFDRLYPNPNFSNYITVRLRPSREYQALHVPPTLMLSPFYAKDFSEITEREKAVENNMYLNKGRKTFLNDRWKYWDDWAQNGAKGFMSSSDYE
ncbi:hypothetical protein [Candidatus Thiosymbion oneisti]|uniref:hypothetical protein n=1 Tax=Candidatus Thiosymbion oneisti TaxID=589554 RepID=UPI00114CA3E4|nr:hypothetical protein [Candidatus Thiosymbion oneisti]